MSAEHTPAIVLRVLETGADVRYSICIHSTVQANIFIVSALCANGAASLCGNTPNGKSTCQPSCHFSIILVRNTSANALQVSLVGQRSIKPVVATSRVSTTKVDSLLGFIVGQTNELRVWELPYLRMMEERLIVLCAEQFNFQINRESRANETEQFDESAETRMGEKNHSMIKRLRPLSICSFGWGRTPANAFSQQFCWCWRKRLVLIIFMFLFLLLKNFFGRSKLATRRSATHETFATLFKLL